ncbi:MAG: hypothetical protein ACXVIY_04140 [Mucilaginibacter sp.]
MKKLFFAISFIAFISIGAANAQKQAQLDNNQYIVVVQSTGANRQVHYKLTNNNSVAMDFTLYKQVTNGSWDVTRHLNLQPSETYEDVNSFTGLTGKYVVYSAPHSDWASFPSSFDMQKLQAAGGAPATAAATPAPTPAATTPASTPAPANVVKPATSAPNAATNKNSAPNPPPPM